MQALSSTETFFALERKQIKDWGEWNNDENFLLLFEGASAEEREMQGQDFHTVNFVAQSSRLAIIIF